MRRQDDYCFSADLVFCADCASAILRRLCFWYKTISCFPAALCEDKTTTTCQRICTKALLFCASLFPISPLPTTKPSPAPQDSCLLYWSAQIFCSVVFSTTFIIPYSCFNQHHHRKQVCLFFSDFFTKYANFFFLLSINVYDLN